MCMNSSDFDRELRPVTPYLFFLVHGFESGHLNVFLIAQMRVPAHLKF